MTLYYHYLIAYALADKKYSSSSKSMILVNLLDWMLVITVLMLRTIFNSYEVYLTRYAFVLWFKVLLFLKNSWRLFFCSFFSVEELFTFISKISLEKERMTIVLVDTKKESMKFYYILFWLRFSFCFFWKKCINLEITIHCLEKSVDRRKHCYIIARQFNAVKKKYMSKCSCILKPATKSSNVQLSNREPKKYPTAKSNAR
jgi:hypothetical protein